MTNTIVKTTGAAPPVSQAPSESDRAVAVADRGHGGGVDGAGPG